MATFIRRSNGVFYIVSCCKGARRWLSLKTRDIREAELVFTEHTRTISKRRFLAVSTFADDFISESYLSVAKPTVAMYRAALSNFLRINGDNLLKSVSPLDIERFKLIRSKEVKPVTVNIDLRILRAAFNHARRLRLLNENPFEAVKLARVETTDSICLDEEDIRKLLFVIKDIEFKKLIIFAILTMVRLGELIHLDWSDIDMARRQIHVRCKKGFQVKGGKSRIIPMNQWIYDYFKAKETNTGLVFKSPSGVQLVGGSISHRFKRFVKRAELSNAVHFHTLRHTGISLLINRGVPQVFVQRIAGHSSLLMTDIYTHTEDRNLTSAVSAFPKFS